MLTIIRRERLAHLVIWARKEGLYRHFRHLLKHASKTHDGGTIKLRLGFLKLIEEEENQGGVSRWAKKTLLNLNCCFGICRE